MVAHRTRVGLGLSVILCMLLMGSSNWSHLYAANDNRHGLEGTWDTLLLSGHHFAL